MRFKTLTTLLVAACFTSGAMAQTAFTAFLDGGQEVPAVATSNTGFGEFILDPVTKLLRYDITVTGLTGTFSAAHIHGGAVGVSGGVVFPLAGGPLVFGGTVGPLSAAQENQLKSGTLYVNVHSSTFPGGEVRGQITATRNQAIVVCTGAKEVPPNPSSGTGSGTLVLNANGTVTYDIDFSGMTGAFTVAHIHDGAAGVSGGVVVGLNQTGPTKLSGTTAALTAIQRAKFRANLLYVNIHSGSFPAGEIRGQITASFTPYGTGCAHAGGLATLSGDGQTRPNGNISVSIDNGVGSSIGILFISPFAFKGSLGFGCSFLVNPGVLLPVTLPLPPSGALTLPAVLPGTITPGTAVALQYVGDKGGGVPYATNGLQMFFSN
jgi:hypothetical protein